MDQGLHGARSGRPLVRVALAIVTAGLLLIGAAGSAAAHADLEGSDPPAGAVLATQPAVVTLTFNEPVEVNAGAVEVFDDRFNRVDSGPVTSVGPTRNRIQVGLRPGLGQGTYTVSWHTSSADTHPVSGSFRFSVGNLSVVRGSVPGGGHNDLAGLLLGVLRWTGYLGLLLGPGVLLTALALWPAGLADGRTRRLTLVGLSLLAVSTVGTMLLQGVWASGEPISALWSAPETLDSHSRRFDEVYALRSYLVLGFAGVLVAALSGSRRPRDRPRPLLLWLTVASTLALLATWPLVGHAASGPAVPLAVAVNLVHTFAMTGWLGGLVLLMVGLGRPEQVAELVALLPRFSRVAFTAVTTLVVTGSYLAWREVRRVDAMTGTLYGRVLLVKLAAVSVVLLLGNVARLWVQRHVAAEPHAAGPGSPTVGDDLVRRFRRGVVAEALLGVVVLALTSALVVIVPAAQDVDRPAAPTAGR